MSESKIITDFGGSGKVVVLLHGFLASASYWKRLQPHLSRAGYRVITIDLLGFGKATKLPASTYSYDEHIHHIHDHLQPLNLTKPFILVGHSMGALLAARYGVLYANAVQTTFLLHPPIYRTKTEVRKTLRDTGRLYRFLLDSRLRNLGWRVLKSIPKIPIGNHSIVSREMTLASIIESTELLTDLERLRIKTLLVVGKRDRDKYLKNISKIQLRKNIRLEIEDVTHHSPIFQPKLIAEKIIRFE